MEGTERTEKIHNEETKLTETNGDEVFANEHDDPQKDN